MDFLYSKVRQFRGLLTPHEKPHENREVTKFEGYFQLLHKILTWEDVSLTLTVFLVLNFVFWLVIQLELRCFGVIFLLLLAAFVGDSYLEDKQFLRFENQHLEAMDQFKADVLDFLLYMKSLRKSSRSSFCITLVFACVALSFIAKNISGQILIYLFLLGVFFTPLAYQRIPQECIAYVKRLFRSFTSDNGVAEEDLIPQLSERDFSFRDPDEQDSLLTDKTADSVTNSLISGLSSMPSHLDADDKESLAEEDLWPSGAISFTPGDSTDSDSEHKEIRFDNRYFLAGDSSSEEENFSKDLTFSKSVDAVDSNNEILSNVISNVASMIKMGLGQASQRKESSSSDSEFEIINPEDLDH